MLKLSVGRYYGDMEDAQLNIHVGNVNPVELLDLTASLTALANEYLRHLQREHPEDSAAEVRLYVKEIKSGSIDASLIAMSPLIFQGLSYTNSVISFTGFIKKSYDYLTGKSNMQPAELDRKTLQNLSQIVEPIAKDAGSQFNIGVLNGNVYQITSDEAKHAQGVAARLLYEDATSAVKLHEKVLLYWYQARNNAKSTAGDKGVIESISTAPVPVVCATDSIKMNMILDKENPFKKAYLVDVSVETINGKPAVYKVYAVHETIARD